MADVVLAVLLVAALAGAQWLRSDLRTVPTVPSAPGTTGRASVAVVVPARNEALTLPPLLASLRALRTPVAEVVVVDDGSTDATAALARAGGARVVDPGTPPPGWTGKAWACAAGAGATTADLLLFLDADTELAPEALDGLLREHEVVGGLVSVQPFHVVRRPYEQLSSYFNAVALLACGAFTRGTPARPTAFGPVLLTSRTDYARAGGHEAVRGEILDDVRLAAAYARAGLAVRCLVGGGAVRMRSYPGGVRQLLAGWTKNIASGAAAADPRATLLTVLWLCAHHAVAVGGLASLLDLLTGWGGTATLGSPLLWLVAWVAVAGQLGVLLRRAGMFRWWTWALFPVPLLAFDLVFARSAALTAVRRSVRWRGREVDLRGNGGAA